MNEPMGKASVQSSPEQSATEKPIREIDFASVVAGYEGPLLRYVVHVGSLGVEEAEDLVQETFLRLHRQCQKEAPAGVRNLSTWLFRVAHNLAMDALRRHGRRRRLQTKLTEQAKEDAARVSQEIEGLMDLEHRELVEHAMQGLEELPEPQRSVLVLKLVKGLSIRQIGEVIDASPGSVSYQLNQGLGKLARQLKRAGVI
jgi:RNA polymerase sigma-70 factor (ECF subfamily)